MFKLHVSKPGFGTGIVAEILQVFEGDKHLRLGFDSRPGLKYYDW